MNVRSTLATACLALVFSFATTDGNAAESVGDFQWGLKLPAKGVPRRVSQGGVRGTARQPLVLADIQGAGCIRRLWITGVKPGRQYILRMVFDGAATPHVEAPLADFFGVMHNMAERNEPYRVDTPFFAVKPKNGFTCYLPMPFAKSARVELVCDDPQSERADDSSTVLYYILDWLEYAPGELTEPMRFCARWRREAPVRDYADDFLMLDADGPGRLVGFVHSVDMLQSRFQMRWSHAGADNIYIDGDTRNPAYLRGIGGEDSFGTSFGGNEYIPGTSLFSDMPFYMQKDPLGEKQKLVGYRFFAPDPIYFERSLQLRFGSRAHDDAATVYWYSSSPVRPYYKLPPLAKRLPGSEVRRGEFDLALPNTGQWWIAGPFPSASPPAWPASGPLDVTKPIEGKSWQKYDALRGFVEFNHVYRPDATNRNSPTLVDMAAMAGCTLVSPTDTRAELTLGWDDALVLRINDDSPIDLGTQTYLKGRTVKAPLKKGSNQVVVWLNNTVGLTRGAWNFSFHAETADGKELLPARP